MSTLISNPISRPIANFHPCRWGDHFLKSSPHDEATQVQNEQEVNKLKEKVKEELLSTKKKNKEELNFVDALERLGVAYHFDEEVEEALHRIYKSHHDQCNKDDLYHVSLRFRILRQHGFHVPCDVFNKFKDENGKFMESLIHDVQGMLSLYEASHVRVHEDGILDEALEFTTTHLKTMSNKLTFPMADKVAQALDQPIHKGMVRLQSRNHISIYEQDPSHNELLLKFAKLDFNLLQSMHKKELRDHTRWWKSIHAKVPYSRDRSTEAYFWILGTYYEPKYSVARKIFSKLFKMVSLMDDTYDAYGNIEELELLTEAVQSWDTCRIDQLPEHVKWCYQALLETFNEVEQEIGHDGRSHYLRYAQEQMKTLCQAYLKEAKWCKEKYIPTYDEYLSIGLVTSGFPFGIVASFVGMEDMGTNEALEWTSQIPMPKAVTASATINRLMNDMGGHKFEQSRNHVASSVQCHILRHGLPSEEHAHVELNKIVGNAWEDLNEAMLRPFAIPKPFLARILNLTRVSNVIYKGEDGYTNVSEAMKQKVTTLLIEPISI